VPDRSFSPSLLLALLLPVFPPPLLCSRSVLQHIINGRFCLVWGPCILHCETRVALRTLLLSSLYLSLLSSLHLSLPSSSRPPISPRKGASKILTRKCARHVVVHCDGASELLGVPTEVTTIFTQQHLGKPCHERFLLSLASCAHPLRCLCCAAFCAWTRILSPRTTKSARSLDCVKFAKQPGIWGYNRPEEKVDDYGEPHHPHVEWRSRKDSDSDSVTTLPPPGERTNNGLVFKCFMGPSNKHTKTTITSSTRAVRLTISGPMPLVRAASLRQMKGANQSHTSR
jgi:hypothetical protein